MLAKTVLLYEFQMIHDRACMEKHLEGLCLTEYHDHLRKAKNYASHTEKHKAHLAVAETNRAESTTHRRNWQDAQKALETLFLSYADDTKRGIAVQRAYEHGFNAGIREGIGRVAKQAEEMQYDPSQYNEVSGLEEHD